MKLHPGILLMTLLTAAHLSQVTYAQELDGSDINKGLRERAEKINKLSIDEQLKLRDAEQKAAQDPYVEAALEKRNKAILEFREAVRTSILKTNPAMQTILDKIAVAGRGF